MAKFKDLPEPPSDMFREAVEDTGTCCATECEFCGRTHFVSSHGHGDYEEGELEKLKEQAAKDPDRYIEESEYDAIGEGYIDGKQAVVHCPCNALRRYEDFIWGHRTIICEYLAARCAKELGEKIRTAEIISTGVNLKNRLDRMLEQARPALDTISKVAGVEP
jgi:hypothetical protein